MLTGVSHGQRTSLYLFLSLTLPHAQTHTLSRFHCHFSTHTEYSLHRHSGVLALKVGRGIEQCRGPQWDTKLSLQDAGQRRTDSVHLTEQRCSSFLLSPVAFKYIASTRLYGPLTVAIGGCGCRVRAHTEKDPEMYSNVKGAQCC